MPLAPPPLTPLGFFSDSEKIYIPAISPSTKSHKLTPLSVWLSGIRRGAKKLTILSLLGLSLWFIVLFLFISIHIIPHTQTHPNQRNFLHLCFIYFYVFQFDNTSNCQSTPLADKSKNKSSTCKRLFYHHHTHTHTFPSKSQFIHAKQEQKKQTHTNQSMEAKKSSVLRNIPNPLTAKGWQH